MGQTSEAKNFKPRKATFTVAKVKGQRMFTAVNRRAHIVAKHAGHRSKLTVSELKALKGAGSYKFYQYTDKGTLTPVKF